MVTLNIMKKTDQTVCSQYLCLETRTCESILRRNKKRHHLKVTSKHPVEDSLFQQLPSTGFPPALYLAHCLLPVSSPNFMWPRTLLFNLFPPLSFQSWHHNFPPLILPPCSPVSTYKYFSIIHYCIHHAATFRFNCSMKLTFHPDWSI